MMLSRQLRLGLGRLGATWCQVCFMLLLLISFTAGVYFASKAGADTLACPEPSCLDALILYHEDDMSMLIQRGGLDSAMENLVGIRNFYILSAKNETLKQHLEQYRQPGMPRVRWIDEKRAPFTREDFEAPRRSAGWFYQQALKFWAVAHVPELCNDVLVLDSDNLWLRKFDVRSVAPKPRLPRHRASHALSCSTYKYKYCLSSEESGAFSSDITNAAYHHFVNWLIGMPKALRLTHTAISNWQVMQRDVLINLERSLQDRGLKSLHDALIAYGKDFNSMSEYEAYFSYVWMQYRDRVEPVYVPFVLRDPQYCDYYNKTLMASLRDTTVLVYATCHDHWGVSGGVDDLFINCRGREEQCGQPPRGSGLWGRLAVLGRQQLGYTTRSPPQVRRLTT